MHFYAYKAGPDAPLGSAGVPLGTDPDRVRLFRHGQYKTSRGLFRHGLADWTGPYWVYTFTNFYDDRTFTLIARIDA